MSAQRIFLGGAAGAVGMRLTPLLRLAGHEVSGTTRSADRAAILRGFGAQALPVDVFDAAALQRAVTQAEPDVVIHQLTDLPRNLDPARMRDAIARNARMCELGTRNLVTAAVAARVRCLVAQSIAWAYAAGPEPHADHAPVHVDAAAYAALLTVECGAPGVYNIAQRNGHVATDKARAELGWSDDFRLTS